MSSRAKALRGRRHSRLALKEEHSDRNLDRVLQEKTTLDEIEQTLRHLTHGAIYHTWDKSLSGPN